MSIRAIRSPALRFLLLVCLGIPCLSYWPLSLIARPGTFLFLGLWAAYGAFIAVLIILCVGPEQWLTWFAIACFLAFVQVGTAVGYLYVLDKCGTLFQHAGTPYTQEQWSYDQTSKGLMMLTVIPYAIFAVHSFSVGVAVSRAARWAGRRKTIAKHAIVAWRVVQHVVEVLPPLFVIWREEHPDLYRPRMRADLQGSFWNPWKSFRWLLNTINVWVRGTLVFALEPVPVFCNAIEVHFAGARRKENANA